MQITAKTKDGYLISATSDEISAIMGALSKPITEKNPITIGDKIPAFDYAAVINQCKNFAHCYAFEKFKEFVNRVSTEGVSIVKALETLSYDC